MRSSRSGSSGRLRPVLLGLVAVAALASGCGGSNKPAATGATTTSNPVGTTTTSASSSTSSVGTQAGADIWDRDAQEYRSSIGKKFTINCVAPGKESAVWGVETYTDDSSICNAAVQEGLITFTQGGEVEIQIAPGQAAYDAGAAHGVTSARYGAWQGSFIFPAAPPGSGTFDVSPQSWQRTATEYREQGGTRITLACSPDGITGSVYGTGTYTDDSSICTAAVHAGLITVAGGGKVTIEIVPGAAAYTGSTAHGITSASWGTFGGSFTFPSSQPSS